MINFNRLSSKSNVRFENCAGLGTGEAATEELRRSSDRLHAVGYGTCSFETSSAGLGPTLWLQQPLPYAHGHPAPSESS